MWNKTLSACARMSCTYGRREVFATGLPMARKAFLPHERSILSLGAAAVPDHCRAASTSTKKVRKGVNKSNNSTRSTSTTKGARGKRFLGQRPAEHELATNNLPYIPSMETSPLPDELRSVNPDDYYYIPLGGSGEIGMNCNLYYHQGKWLMVDLGVVFGQSIEGVDTTVPDTAFIEGQARNLAGLVITHAHEDHIGAINWLLPRLQCPVYCTAFTAHMIRGKASKRNMDKSLPDVEIEEYIRIVQPNKRINIGPFDVEWQPITHSIPEANAIVLRTDHGIIFHTGDWKIDDNPLIGEPWDYESMEKLGKEGVLAVVGDSTNAIREEPSGSEGLVRTKLTELVQGVDEGMVAVTCFASNLARMQSLQHAAVQSGRKAALLGRSLLNSYDIISNSGYNIDLPEHGIFVPVEEVMKLPPSERLLICTGCQGESLAAVSRLSTGDNDLVKLTEDDTVLFSSSTIPGNEATVNRVTNNLLRLGVNIMKHGEKGVFAHVSGHPSRTELRELYDLLRPEMLIPVHGEYQHQDKHAALATQECGVNQAVIPVNGDILQITPTLRKVGTVQAGHMAIDGSQLRQIQSKAIKRRQEMLNEGVCMISIPIGRNKELIATPAISMPGIMEDEDKATMLQNKLLIRVIVAEVLEEFHQSTTSVMMAQIHKRVNQFIRKKYGKTPSVQIHFLRINTSSK